MVCRALRTMLVILALLMSPLVSGPGTARAAGNPARVVGEVGHGRRTLDIAISSPELEGPVRTKWVRLLLPEGWSRTAHRTWPTLWLLHGGTGNHTDWTAHTHIEQLTAGRDVIVVMPETSGCSSYSNWWNHGAGGPPAWETYLLDEVRPLLERDYRAGPRRAIAGLSMGGLGALKFAAARPGMFGAAASYSGMANPLFTSPDGGLSGPDLVKAGAVSCLEDWRRIWGEPGYPFGTEDPGEVRQRAIWELNSPLYQAQGLAGTPLYLSYGNGTDNGPGWKWGDPPPSRDRCANPPAPGKNDAIEAAAHGMNEQLRARLAQLAIPATVCASTGTHSWPYWERELVASFPMLMGALGA